jgi:16S rRNA (cytosine1402-N4)-methyltransferase
VAHKAVLVEELIGGLNLKAGMSVVDATLGAGGHSLEILKKILPGGKLISIDWDEDAVTRFENIFEKKGIAVSANKMRIKARLQGKVRQASLYVGQTSPAPVKSNAHGEIFSPFAFLQLFSGDKIVGYWCGVRDNYANLYNIGKILGIKGINAVCVDLGFSSDQIEDTERGFSFLRNGPLDMRYSQVLGIKTAAEVVNEYPQEKLFEIFRKYGEERYAGRIAAAISEAKKKQKILETGQLVNIISGAVPEKYKRGRVHFATRVFQALRIEVNQELENLNGFLDQATEMLIEGGRLGVISFHSLEDRIVKRFFQKESRDCVCPPSSLKCTCSHEKKLKIITKKPIIPGSAETKENPRARSAKLRIAEKI